MKKGSVKMPPPPEYAVAWIFECWRYFIHPLEYEMFKDTCFIHFHWKGSGGGGKQPSAAPPLPPVSALVYGTLYRENWICMLWRFRDSGYMHVYKLHFRLDQENIDFSEKDIKFECVSGPGTKVLGVRTWKNVERFTILRVILAQGPC